MNKRILSMLLALCMVFVALPVFVVAVVAADSEEATVNISFCLPDGTNVCTRTIPAGVADFATPTAEEIAAAVEVYNAKAEIKGKYELTAEDILGFYDVSVNGTITDAAAYKGTLINKDKNFYAFTTKSVFKPGNNWPRYTDKTSFDGYRGGWSVGYYSSSDKTITAYTSFDTTYNILDAGNTWGQGGLYVAADPHMVTLTNTSTALIWKAIAPGTIDIGMDYFGFTSTNVPEVNGAKPSFSDIAFAIAKNGVIVWPEAAAGAIADTWAGAGSDETTNKWYYVKSDTLTQDMTQKWKDDCTTNGDAPTGITVAAGDEIQFIFKKATVACVTCYPTVTYTEVVGGVDNEAAKIMTGFDKPYTTSFYSTSRPRTTNYAEGHYPIFDYSKIANGAKVTYYGNWDIVSYTGKVWDDSHRARLDTIGNYNGTKEDVFLTNKGAFGWNSTTIARLYGADYWGTAGAVTVAPKDIGGYRYIAEFSGLVDLSLSSYKAAGGSGYAAIFVNGQMVWPHTGDYMADSSKWASVTTTEATPADLPTGLLVAKGDMIEFLVMSASTSEWVRGVQVAPLTVTYTQGYDAQITTSGKVNADGTYSASLKVPTADMDAVTVEAADDCNGQMSDYVELTAVNGVYTVTRPQKNGTTRTITFRVTMRRGEQATVPQYVSCVIPSRYTALYHTGFGLSQNAPTTSGSTVSYRGNWDFMIYNSVEDIGTDAGNVAGTVFAGGGTYFISDKAYQLGDPFTFTTGFAISSADWGGYTYGAYVRGNTAAAWRYTAEKTGLADISLDKLGHTTSPWEYDMGYAIFLNGEKIWPTADTAIEGVEFKDGWLRSHGTDKGEAKENLLTAEQLALIDAQLKNIYLREGDTLEFVCRALANTDNWSNCGNVCYASVDYTAWEEAELPTVDTVSAVMGTDFGFVLNCANNNPQVAELLATATIGNRDLTVTVNSNTVRITGIRATEMTDTITYRVYARSTNGTVATSRLVKEATTTYADLLAGYLVEGTDVKVKDMAIATLKYGAAAQTRFLYRTDDLATRVLGEGDTLSFTVPTAANEYAQTSAATNYRFAGASFLLNEKIQLKLFIDLQAGQEALNETLYLEIAEGDGEFKRSDAKISQRAVSDPSNAYLKAVLDLNPTANASVYRFRLVTESGTVVSTELTYSVATYAYSAVEDKALTDAILAFGQAARNYNNV